MGHLNAAELLHCCQVSRALRNAATNEALWRHLCTATWPEADAKFWMVREASASRSTAGAAPSAGCPSGGKCSNNSPGVSTPIRMPARVRGDRSRRAGGGRGGLGAAEAAGSGIYSSWRALYGELRQLEPLLLSHGVWRDRSECARQYATPRPSNPCSSLCIRAHRRTSARADFAVWILKARWGPPLPPPMSQRHGISRVSCR